MDERAFRQLRTRVATLPCLFERAILRNCAACEQAGRLQIAEREVVTCSMPASHERCAELHAQLRRSFSFALGSPQTATPLPHAQAMRVQCGGLKGLQHTLDGSTEVANIDQSLTMAVLRWGAIADIPYSQVVHAAALAYQGRHG